MVKKMTVDLQESRQFDADVAKIFKLMINSIYTNQDIFLRELISNSSDAIDKRRYLGQSDASLLEEDIEWRIDVSFNKEKSTITIRDNGIGMDRDELINNLGRIASSGTQRFLETLKEQPGAVELIGQFGVGFYSAFMVADSVEVISHRAGANDTWRWYSDGEGEYQVGLAENPQPVVGTTIILHLRPEAAGYLDRFRLRHIIKTYSDHISVPIHLKAEDEAESEVVNSASALWSRNKNEISQEQYTEFYRQVSFAGDEPWMVLHNKNEGIIEFTNLLFIPKNKPFDLFHPDRKPRVKLYVRRVFITDDQVNLVPAYLRFLRGVVDSADLPLNISRETLQHNNIIEKIQKAIIKRTLAELKRKAEADEDSYLAFWNNFGAVLKEGLCEAMAERERQELLEVCRFSHSLDDRLISLDEYLEKMAPNQKQIYYLVSDDLEQAKRNPQLAGFTERGISVLLLSDPVDDFWVNVVSEYKDKGLCPITRAGIDLAETPLKEKVEGEKVEPKKKEAKVDEKKLLEFFRNTLGTHIKDVQVSHKLTSSPAALAVPEGGMDLRMERFLIAQRQLPAASPKILEINVGHPLVTHLAAELERNSTSAQSLTWLIYDQACIIEGEPLVDSGAFAKRLNELLLSGVEQI